MTRVNTPGWSRPPKVISFTRSPMVAETAITNRRYGKPITISVRRETKMFATSSEV
jgi:hypothetical protein